jgi:hypothetical protein
MPTAAEFRLHQARLTGQREQLASFSQTLRKNLAAWRAQEAERHPISRALCFSLNEAWIARIDSFLADTDALVQALVQQESLITDQARAAEDAERAPPAPPPEPPAPPQKTPTKRRRR